MTRATFTSEDNASLVLVVEIGGHSFGLAVRELAEIVPMAELSCRGDEPSVLAGFLNLRGAAVPVLRTSRLLEIASAPVGAEGSIVVVRHGDERFGLVVNAVRQITATARDAVVALASPVRASSAARIGERIVPILSLSELLLQQERLRIEELRASHNRRLAELSGVPA